MKIIEKQSLQAAHLIRAIKGLEDKEVKVGWITGSHYIESNESVAQVAAQNEYGNPKKNIPARPFMRPAVMEHEKEWKKLVDDGTKKVINEKITFLRLLDLLGHKVEGDIKLAIKKVYYPALAERTILDRIERNKRLSGIKGQIKESALGNITKPLIDTGIMFNTITHEVS